MMAVTASSAEATLRDDRVGVVLLVIVDQLTSEHIDRYRPLLRGGLGRMIRTGALYREGRFAYGNTETGPGHATVATGAWPDVHGIVGNAWVDRASGAMVRCVEDRTLGTSPHYMRAPGIADALKLATRGQGRVVAFGIKPRSSVLTAGQRPDLVVWYDDKAGRYVPGRYKDMPAPPAWFVRTAMTIGPELSAGQTWDRYRLDVDYAAWAQPDDRPSERDMPGLGRTFPRRLGTPAAAWPVLYKFTPASLDDLMTLATAAVDSGDLGHDAAPDLLYLGISTFDYVGHAFGPGSQESLDILLRIDAALGRLQDRLTKRLGAGRVLTVVTSDHGVLPMPEAARAYGTSAGRIAAQTFHEVLDGQVRAIHPPRLYLKSSLRRGGPSPVKARRALAARLAARPEILEAYVPEDVDRFPAPYRTFFRRMLVDGRTPDIIFRHAPLQYVSSQVAADGTGQGTGHGSPYLYDQTVPILLSGPKVRSLVDARPVMMTRVAPTIAAVLGIPPPAAAHAEPLEAVQ